MDVNDEGRAARVSITPVPYEDKHILFNLMQLCQHDYQEFDGAT